MQATRTLTIRTGLLKAIQKTLPRPSEADLPPAAPPGARAARPPGAVRPSLGREPPDAQPSAASRSLKHRNWGSHTDLVSDKTMVHELVSDNKSKLNDFDVSAKVQC